MKASLFRLAFESRLTLLCTVIGSSLPEYFPFWRGDNPPLLIIRTPLVFPNATTLGVAHELPKNFLS
jgi:hypothetical protein